MPHRWNDLLDDSQFMQPRADLPNDAVRKPFQESLDCFRRRRFSLTLTHVSRIVLQVVCSILRLYRLESCISSKTRAGSDLIFASPLFDAQISRNPSRYHLRLGSEKPRSVRNKLTRDWATPTKFEEQYRTSLVTSKNFCINCSTGKTPSSPWQPAHTAMSICFVRSNVS